MNLQLKQIRKESRVSQEELAKRIGVSARAIGAWERGENSPNAEQVWNCAVALGCSPNDICGWYIDHPEDRPAPPGDPGAAELLGCYRSCTPERAASSSWEMSKRARSARRLAAKASLEKWFIRMTSSQSRKFSSG